MTIVLYSNAKRHSIFGHPKTIQPFHRSHHNESIAAALKFHEALLRAMQYLPISFPRLWYRSKRHSSENLQPWQRKKLHFLEHGIQIATLTSIVGCIFKTSRQGEFWKCGEGQTEWHEGSAFETLSNAAMADNRAVSDLPRVGSPHGATQTWFRNQFHGIRGLIH